MKARGIVRYGSRVLEQNLRRCRPLRYSSSQYQVSEHRFLVSELFGSIQGEGPFTGRPSVFLRLGQCNLSCVWCDTPYTWLFTEERLRKVLRSVEDAGTIPRDTATDAETLRVHDKQAELKKLTVSEVQRQIESLADPATRSVVITGGEPLLHAKPLQHLVPRLLADGYTVEVETNGTIMPVGLPDSVHFNVSPKLSNSCQSESTRLNFDVLAELMARPSAVLKFVVARDSDVHEVAAIVEKLGVASQRVFLMPQGKSSDILHERGPWVVDVCRSHGYHYSHRVHVDLWGDKRGV